MQKSSDRTQLILFVFFLLFYLLTARGHIRGTDETVMFTTMVNAWQHHTLAIDELAELQEKIGVGDYGIGGHLYSKLPVGNAIFAVGLYALGEYAVRGTGMVFAGLTNPIISAVGMVLLYSFIKKRFRPSTALAVTLLIGICSDWWFETRGFGSEVGGGVLLLASLVAADAMKPFASALAFGVSLLFRPLNLLAAPVWGLNALRCPTSTGLRRTAFSGLIIAGFIIALLAYNILRFGTPLNFGYVNEHFSTPPWTGLFYLFFSPGRSIFLYSPVLLLAFPGACLWMKRDRPMGWALISTILIYLLSNAAWHSWDSGWSWGSRLFTPMVPLVGVLFAPVIEEWGDRLLVRALVFLLGAWGLGIGILALMQDPLLTMQNWVMSGIISYKETLFSMSHSLLALQIQDLHGWHPVDIDAFFLRILLMLFGISNPA